MVRFPMLEVRLFLDSIEKELREVFALDYQTFPVDACGDTCSKLFREYDIGKFLKGWKPKTVNGYFYVPEQTIHWSWGEHGHAWIACSDGTIIDPTGGQFFDDDPYYRIFMAGNPMHKRYSLKRTGR